MSEVKTFEEFQKKLKELEKLKIGTEERLKTYLKQRDDSAKELYKLTETKSMQEAIEYMKSIKQEIDKCKEELNKEITRFNSEIQEAGL